MLTGSGWRSGITTSRDFPNTKLSSASGAPALLPDRVALALVRPEAVVLGRYQHHGVGEYRLAEVRPGRNGPEHRASGRVDEDELAGLRILGDRQHARAVKGRSADRRCGEPSLPD